MSIADNLRSVEERIARACEAVGRRPEEITLVGVTKYVGVAQASELVTAGCHNLGESRPQELWDKHELLSNQSIRWHLIGHLQRNKVRRTLPLIQMIHSVDSERLLLAIHEEAAANPSGQTSPIKVLLEVNTSGEAAKGGLSPNEVEPLLAKSPQYGRVEICGLMTMAALEGGNNVAARNFATLRELRDKLRSNVPAGVHLDELSMGMSGDFEVAVREGATIVRVGSLLWE